MNGLKKDELGFIRAHGFGRVSAAQLEKELDIRGGEGIYVTGNRAGAKRSSEVTGAVEYRPGDTFSVGPRITKADGGKNDRKNDRMNRVLKDEVKILKSAGLGFVPEPALEGWGWSVRMKGLVLPGGSRTDAMICLPENYPISSPMGFYIKKGESPGGADTSHLFSSAVYHGAKNLSKEGWAWFCGVPQTWIPGRHNLLSYVNAVMTLLTEKMAG
jgi:hypothetical protein